LHAALHGAEVPVLRPPAAPPEGVGN
jgi:hypothetical protein